MYDCANVKWWKCSNVHIYFIDLWWYMCTNGYCQLYQVQMYNAKTFYVHTKKKCIICKFIMYKCIMYKSVMYKCINYKCKCAHT